ncbi:hypothetical protein L2Y94_13275 [Luteibacter aegosomatis]|uniref:hypothetical protein n=1 Tax=Luteibacter aegosomatis TaxID=2911537 RepID=UPI001FF7A658|nr:hypothetical protein [Luteibacter aegosomatis]UPG84312.1 hypothetical protein L2Y94_13275 [Luteibacter aegosomatis]
MTARFSPNLAAIRAGAFFGILAMFSLVVLIPIGLEKLFGLPIAKAWGLGDLAAPLCLAGALPGAAFATRRRKAS